MSDEFDSIAIPDNILARVKSLESQVRALQIRNSGAQTLSEISPDAGELRAGAFICGEGDPFGAGDPFTGCAMTFPPVELSNGDQANILGSNAGTPEFWLSALTGEGVFGGGAARLNRNGGCVNGLTAAWTLNAVNGSYNRQGSLGMYLPAGSQVPALALIHQDPDYGPELVTNPGFETGDVTGWSRGGEIWITSDYKHTGNYGLIIPVDDVNIGNIGVLSMANRVAVTPGKKYLVSAYLEMGGNASCIATVNWYDAATDGNLIRSDTWISETEKNANWRQFQATYSAPAKATHANISFLFEITRLWPYYDSFIDDISFKETEIFSSLTFEPDITIRGGSIQNESLGIKPVLPAFPGIFAYGNRMYTQRPGLPGGEILDCCKQRERVTSWLSAAYTSASGLMAVNTNAPTTFGTEALETLGTQSTRFYKYTTAATTNYEGGACASSTTTLFSGWSPLLFAKIKTGPSIASYRFYCGFHSVKPNAATAPGVWITLNYNSAVDGYLKAMTNIGAGGTVTTNLVTFTADTEYTLEIFVDYANLKIYFVVNGGVTVVTPSGAWDTTTGLNPYCYIQTLAAAAKVIKIARLVWEYD